MAISSILEVSRQGMEAMRKSMQVSTNNVANANTPGYSRQRAEIKSVNTTRIGGLNHGAGVDVRDVIRVHDTFVEKQLLEEAKGFGGAKMRSQGLQRLERVLSNENFRVGDLVNEFFNAARELSANPEQTSMKMGVVEAAKSTAAGFNRLHSSLNAVKDDMDLQLESKVRDVNRLTHELADLNLSIASVGAHETPHALLDRRDQVIREVSGLLGLDTSNDQFGRKLLTMGGVGILVNGAEATDLVLLRTPEKGTKEAGSYEVFLKTPEGLRSVQNVIKEGELGGLMDVRDTVVSPALRFLDRAAFEFANEVNAVHRSGVAKDGTTGHNLFDDLNGVVDAAHGLRVTDDVAKSPDKLAVSYEHNAPSDNRVALDLVAIQEKKVMSDTITNPYGETNLQTLNEGLNTIVGEVAVKAQHQQHMFDHQKGIIDQLENYRESVSGVSLEEEAINMRKFQAVFNASAKAMKAGADMFETVMGLV